MIQVLKRLFCRHKWEIVRRIDKFQSLRGELLYRRCEKCGKVVKHICREYEGNGFK